MGRSKKNKGNNSNHTQNYHCQRHFKKKKSKKFRTKRYIPKSESELVRRVQSQPGIGSKLVLFMKHGLGTHHSLVFSTAKINGKVIIKEVLQEDQTKLQLTINNVVIAEILAQTSLQAKNILSAVAFEKLQKECFTIVKKMKPRDQEKVELPSASKSDLLVNGIGAKIMEKMGWTGQGLGSKQQGRIDIVRAQFNLNRQGLGNKSITGEVWELLREYSASKDLNSMAFSPDFTREERKAIHELADKLNLRTKSYGKDDQRFLLVENRIHPWELVDKLLEIGGENEQYKLITPTNFL